MSSPSQLIESSLGDFRKPMTSDRMPDGPPSRPVPRSGVPQARTTSGTGSTAVAVIAMLVLAACGHDPGEAGTTGDTPAHASRMVVVPFEDAAFVPVRSDMPESPEIAVLRGDPDSGPSAMLMRLRTGHIPMHVHSSSYQLVVLQGIMKHWDSRATEAEAPELGPGSYWFQPADRPHAEACLTETCLLHVVWEGARDARLAP